MNSESQAAGKPANKEGGQAPGRGLNPPHVGADKYFWDSACPCIYRRKTGQRARVEDLSFFGEGLPRDERYYPGDTQPNMGVRRENGEGGIRTRGPPKADTGFRDRLDQPLRHLSKCKLSIFNCQLSMPSTAKSLRIRFLPERARLLLDTDLHGFTWINRRARRERREKCEDRRQKTKDRGQQSVVRSPSSRAGSPRSQR